MSLLVELVASQRFAHLARHFVEMLPPFEIGAVLLARHLEFVAGGNPLLIERFIFGGQPDAFFTTRPGVSHSLLFSVATRKMKALQATIATSVSIRWYACSVFEVLSCWIHEGDDSNQRQRGTR